MIVGASGGGLLFPVVGLHGLLGIGAALCAGGLLVLVADSVALRPARHEASSAAEKCSWRSKLVRPRC
jgi:hypothetical protein